MQSYDDSISNTVLTFRPSCYVSAGMLCISVLMAYSISDALNRFKCDVVRHPKVRVDAPDLLRLGRLRHLTHLFRQHLGISVRDYHEQLRLTRLPSSGCTAGKTAIETSAVMFASSASTSVAIAR